MTACPCVAPLRSPLPEGCKGEMPVACPSRVAGTGRDFQFTDVPGIYGGMESENGAGARIGVARSLVRTHLKGNGGAALNSYRRAGN